MKSILARRSPLLVAVAATVVGKVTERDRCGWLLLLLPLER
jgi:hypothetical protein